ncbi:hypothetical protein ACH5RR_033239 [Cinchona calisaya]|uniref:STAS domain-containing protein n=1 Tax=Cinchona calisaya TaxID=153742 RepID=A0ABD2YPS6_9GENT
MGNDFDFQCQHRVESPPSKPFFKNLGMAVKETLFPDDPFRQFKDQPFSRKCVLGFQYFVPILEWAPRYTFEFFKADLIAGITIASLAVPQGISYAKLANLPPIMGLYTSFVPPLIYAMLGSSRDLAVGTTAIPSLLIASMLGNEVQPAENPKLYVELVLTATLFTGIFQASLGLLRLGFIVDFLSHATIVGYIGGAATVVCLQQMKGILGLVHFTHETDIVEVMKSIFSQTHQWKWQSGVLGCCFLLFLFITKYLSKKKPAFFWMSVTAPLTSVIFGSALVYLTHADKHGVQVIGQLKKGLNPLSFSELSFDSPYLITAIKTGVITGILSLAEGIAVGRSFATLKDYHIDGNKEMLAFGLMNIAGSCTSCYLTSGVFSRTAVSFNAGCKTAMTNIGMAIVVMITLLFFTPLFHYTPLLVLSSIIIAAMIGFVDYEFAIHLWKIDKFDFTVCLSAFIGVVFGSVTIGLVISVGMSLLRILLFVARPRTVVMGNIPNSLSYRSIDQYPTAINVPGIFILRIDSPIYFANASYLRERISRWIDEEEDRLKSSIDIELQYVILDMSAVATTDTSGVSMLEEVKKNMDRRCLQLVLANPGSEVMKKLNRSKLTDIVGQEWIFLTVAEAVYACTFMLHSYKQKAKATENEGSDNNV